MNRFALTPTATLVVQEGDITRVAADAIVNAANERMLGGGGVDGAIHRRAGPELRAACEEVSEVRPGVRCPTGEARVTPGFKLPCICVIHTVGPVYESARASEPLLASAYRSCLLLANEHRLRSVAFPAVSCGVYGYPVEDAARVATACCAENAGDLREIHFVLFGAETHARWLSVARRMLEPQPPD